MANNIPKEIQQLLMLQKILKTPVPEILNQLALGIAVNVNNCRTCEVEVKDNYVQINLYKFPGLKGRYFTLLKKYKLTEEQNEIILKLVKFWLSFVEQPVLNVVWR